ncbi:AMP-dependent synthetase/ligase [Methylomonas sp. 2BW1-5-20]|uniref:AMP-dependent synthetase/ligase n=1 Tax=Methylomonas sp. 2BW1-5-20 TaxID=3376686 RepID=UPI00404F4F62
MNRQATTLPALLEVSAREKPNEIAAWYLDKNEQWSPVSFQEFYRRIIGLTWKFKSLGIDKGHVVAIMATTGLEWELLHHAVLAIGGIVVGIDPDEATEQLALIVKTAGIKTLIIDKSERLDKFGAAETAQLQSIIRFGSPTTDKNIEKLTSLDILGILPDGPEPRPLGSTIHPEDIATIIFTSGTTGTPKGVAYRHEQIIAAIKSILDTYPELSELPCHLVCWLPLSNLFQRIINLCAIASGAQVYFVNRPQLLLDYLPGINPHIFIAVPRFYEKLYQGLEAKLNQHPKPVARLLRLCLSVGETDSNPGKIFRTINRRLFHSFIAIFGENIRFAVSGSAPMPLSLLRRFYSLGLVVLEAYGLSENVIPIAANRFSEFRFGSVGKPMKGNTVLQAEDHELLVKGQGVFNGYLASQDPVRHLNADGYLATGDYAEIDAQGFIHLRGRKSELFKTSTGRKIAPVAIETLLQHTPEVEHAIVFGESRQFLISLITTAEHRPLDNITAIAQAQKLAMNLKERIAELPNYKRPVGVILRYASLSIERQELTGTLKVRRQNIYRQYHALIDALYQALDDPSSAIHKQPIVIEQGIVLLKL